MTIIEREEKVKRFLNYFEGKEFKENHLVLNKAEKIIDLPKFIKYHISIIKHNHKKRFCKPYILALNNIKRQLEK